MKTQNLMAGIVVIFLLSGYLLGQGGWTDDGSVVRLTTSTDNVGIGTTTPYAALELGEDGVYKGLTVHGDIHMDAPNFNNRYFRFVDMGVSKYALRYVNASEYLGFYEYRSTNADVMVIRNGNVGIGTTYPQAKLAVNGKIRAKEVVVETGWSDHVFADGYRLRPLAEVEAYVKEHNHLPDIPSAAEVEDDGVALGEMQARLLQKVEELTLYVIALQKENDSLKTRVVHLEEEL